MGVAGGVDIISNTVEIINNYSTRHVKASIQGNAINFYLLTNGQYLITVFYDYGENGQDKALVDQAIKTINLGSSVSSESPLYNYQNSPFNFSLKTSGGWIIMLKYIGNEPINIYNKQKNIKVTLSVTKETENFKGLSDELVLNQVKASISAINTAANKVNTRAEITKSSINTKINNQLDKVILVESLFKKISTGEVNVRELSYTMRKSGNIYVFRLSAVALNDQDYVKAVGDFNTMLNGFSWGIVSQPIVSSGKNVEVKQPSSEIKTNAKPSSNIDKNLSQKLGGKSLLQVEDSGQAWYVDSKSLKRYYLADGASAYNALKTFGLGITNSDLEKIPVGIESRALGLDSDNDGLDDKLEEALGTNPFDPDSDKDGYLDGVEVLNGYNPLGAGRSKVDAGYGRKMEGKILLQVQNRGEAWYVYNGKRYYLADGEAAYKIMRFMSLGITNANLSKIEESR